MYYVYEYKEEDHVEPVRDKEEAMQMLTVTYKAGSGTIPLGYMDNQNVIHLFEPAAKESASSLNELMQRISMAIDGYLLLRAARHE